MSRRVLTREECQRLVTAVQRRVHGNGRKYRHATRDALVLRTLLETGCTVRELLDLSTSQVYAAVGESYVFLPAVAGSDRTRVVPVPRGLALSLIERGTGRLFDLTDRAVRRLVRGYGERARVGLVTPYTLRRTWAAREFQQRRRPINEIAETLAITTAATSRMLVRELAATGVQHG